MGQGLQFLVYLQLVAGISYRLPLPPNDRCSPGLRQWIAASRFHALSKGTTLPSAPKPKDSPKKPRGVSRACICRRCHSNRESWISPWVGCLAKRGQHARTCTLDSTLPVIFSLSGAPIWCGTYLLTGVHAILTGLFSTRCASATALVNSDLYHFLLCLPRC